MFNWINKILRRADIEKQLIRVYESWFRYTLNDDRTQRELICLFELIPEKIKFRIIRDIRKPKEDTVTKVA